MNALLITFDIVAGIILMMHAFCGIVYMSRSTRHDVRLVYIVLEVGAFIMVLSPLLDAEWRRYAHVAVIVAYAVLVIVDQRKRQIISLGS